MASTQEILHKYFGQQSINEIRNNQDMKLFNRTFKPISYYTKLQLPYKAPQHPEIPPIEEIEEAITVASIADRLKSYSGTVCSIGLLFIKRSANVAIVQDAENLLYLQALGLELRTPTIYAVFQRDIIDEQGKTHHVYYMVQERIQGYAMTDCLWLGLEPRDRQKICSGLVKQFHLLQAIRPPADFSYGRVQNQGWLEFSPMLQTTCDELCGPYSSYDEFREAIYHSVEFQSALWQKRGLEEQTRQQLLAKFNTALKRWSSRPTFTHIDPHGSNTVVRRIPSTTKDGEDNWEVTLIDWEGAGWFPDWVQKSMLQSCVWFTAVFPSGKTVAHKQEDQEFMDMMSGAWDESYEEHLKLFKELKTVFGYRITGK